jgi:hypothetical protein
LTTQVRLILTGLLLGLTLSASACGSNLDEVDDTTIVDGSSDSISGGAEEFTGDQTGQQPQEGSATDPYSLDCGQLKFLADKYSSIADDALRLEGDSPAAEMGRLQGIQAANKASELYSVIAQRGC